MAKSYVEIYQEIINALVGRAAGTQIQPEDHQQFALDILEYADQMGNVVTNGFIDEATPLIVPVQPDNANVTYVFEVAPDTTKTFANFRDSGGNPISVTTNASQAAIGFLIWNKAYWKAITAYMAVSDPSYEVVSGSIIQFMDGDDPVYPVTLSEAVKVEGTTTVKDRLRAEDFMLTYVASGGYCYIENNALYFSKMALWNKNNPLNAVRLNDGIHSWTEDNVISLTDDNKSFYVLISDLLSGNNSITLYYGQVESDQRESILSLGIYSTTQLTVNGLLDQFLTYKKNNDSNRVLQENHFYLVKAGTDAYAKIENGNFIFKNLYFRGGLINKVIALCDGVHSYDQSNSIALLSPLNFLYISKSDFESSSFDEYNPVAVHTADNSNFPNVEQNIILGIALEGEYFICGYPLNELLNENNLVEVQKEIKEVRDTSLFTESGYIKTDGTEAVNADCKRTDFIPVTEGDVFYYTGWINSGSATLGACIVGYDSNKDFVSVVLPGFPNFSNGYKFHKIVIPSGISYIRACSAFLEYSSYNWIGYLIRSISDVVSNILERPEPTPPEDNLNVKYPNLENKKVVFFGDSITAAGIYESEFASLSGCVAYNRGVGGTTFAQISSSLLWNESLADRVDLPAQEGTGSSNRGLPSNPDLIFVFAGINDWGRVAKNNETPVPAGGGSYQPEDYITGERFGDPNFEDKTTFCGAVRYVFRRLKTKYPSVPIVSILPLHTYSPDQYPLWSELKYATPSDESSDWTIQKSTDDDKSLYDYRNAIRMIASDFGIPVIDTFEMGITPILSVDKTAYYNEGLHPNTNGYHLLGNFIYKQLPKEFLLKSV